MSETTTKSPSRTSPPPTDDGWGKFFAGLLFGAALTWYSVTTGYKPPKILEIPQKVAALPHQLVATTILEDPESTADQRQRAIATLLKHDDDLFARIDDALEGQFTDAVLQEKVDHRLIRAKHYRGSFDKVLASDKYEALRQTLERKYGSTDTDVLRRRMLADQLRDDELLLQTLQDRYPGESTEQLAERVLQPSPIRR